MKISGQLTAIPAVQPSRPRFAERAPAPEKLAERLEAFREQYTRLIQSEIRHLPKKLRRRGLEPEEVINQMYLHFQKRPPTDMSDQTMIPVMKKTVKMLSVMDKEYAWMSRTVSNTDLTEATGRSGKGRDQPDFIESQAIAPNGPGGKNSGKEAKTPGRRLKPAPGSEFEQLFLRLAIPNRLVTKRVAQSLEVYQVAWGHDIPFREAARMCGVDLSEKLKVQNRMVELKNKVLKMKGRYQEASGRIPIPAKTWLTLTPNGRNLLESLPDGVKGHKIPRFIRRFSRWMRRLAELQYYDAETSRLIRRWFSPKNRFHGFGYSTKVNTIDPGPRSLREGTRQKIHAFTAMIQQHPVYLAFPPEDWRKIQFIVDIVKPALPGELREAYPKEKALVGRLLSDLNFALANGYFTPEQTRDLSQYFEVAGRVGEARQRRNGQRELMLFLVENLKRPEPERMSYEDWRQLLKSVRFDKVRLKTYPKRQPRIHLDPGLIQHPPEGIAERVWNRLSQSHREVVYLGHQGFRPPDIASSLGIRKSSAEKYLQEAKKQLGMGDDN